MEGIVMAGQLFFVAAMPRSGTAWTSQLLSLCPNAYCLHEGEAQFRDDLAGHLRSQKEFYAGDSAPTACLERFDHIEAKRVCIMRPMGEVIPSTLKALHGLVTQKHLWDHLKILQEWCVKHSPLLVEFNDLFTLEGSREIWEYLLPGEYFPEHKVSALIRVRVEQVIPDRETILKSALQQ